MIPQLNTRTHSYTIQPVLSMERKLSPMLICLQEVNGQFPTTIQLPNYENLVIRCSKSGKLNKELVRDFFQNVFKLIVEQNPKKGRSRFVERSKGRTNFSKMIMLLFY